MCYNTPIGTQQEDSITLCCVPSHAASHNGRYPLPSFHAASSCPHLIRPLVEQPCCSPQDVLQKMARAPKYLKARPAWQKKAMVAYARRTLRSGRVSGGISGDTNVFRTHSTVVLSTVTGSVTIDTNVPYSFTLNALPNATDLVKVYDEYRIDSVKMTFYPYINRTGVGTTVGNPIALTTLDFDDDNAFNVADLEQYENCKVHDSRTAFSRTVIPAFAVAAYSGAFTSYAQKRGWVDCGSPSVKHYGIKVSFPQEQTSVNSWVPVVEMSLSFRRVR